MHLTRQMFEKNRDTKFWLEDAEGSRAALDLVEVRNGQAPPRYEVFSVIFRGEADRIHPQRTYTVEHEAMGSFDLFLVPVGRDPHGVLYEAVFNRAIDAQSEVA